MDPQTLKEKWHGGVIRQQKGLRKMEPSVFSETFHRRLLPPKSGSHLEAGRGRVADWVGHKRAGHGVQSLPLGGCQGQCLGPASTAELSWP